MRSHTRDDLPGRCKRCWIREEFCICAQVPTLATQVEVVLVRHEAETRKSTGTARVAVMALPNCRVFDFDDDPAQANERLPLLTDAWLVYPDDGAPLADVSTPPKHLVFLDGTWRQTRKMLKKLPKLQPLPRLALPQAAADILRLRDTTFDEGRSTIEAIADALEVAAENNAAAGLRALHDQFVERVFKARGVWELKREAFERERSRRPGNPRFSITE